MVCNETRALHEQRARALLEEMDDDALAAITKVLEATAKKHPRHPVRALNTLAQVETKTKD